MLAPAQAPALVARKVRVCLRVGAQSSCPGPSFKFLPIASSGRTGKDQVDFGLAEPHTVLFHEPGSDFVWVGGRGKVYLFSFPEGRNTSVHTVSPGCSPLPSTSLLVSPLAAVRELREPGGGCWHLFLN